MTEAGNAVEAGDAVEARDAVGAGEVMKVFGWWMLLAANQLLILHLLMVFWHLKCVHNGTAEIPVQNDSALSVLP